MANQATGFPVSDIQLARASRIATVVQLQLGRGSIATSLIPMVITATLLADEPSEYRMIALSVRHILPVVLVKNYWYS